MNNCVTVSSPARLHFGLFSVAKHEPTRFGGVGLMLDQPRTKVTAKPSSELEVSSGEVETTTTIVELCFPAIASLIARSAQALDPCDDATKLPVAIDVSSVLPRHSGFGSGTQLALSIATALYYFFDLPIPSPEELSKIVNRGKRSAIGTHGFFQGGFLVDRGKIEEQEISPLDFRTDFPEPWTVLTVTLTKAEGLSGQTETSAFQDLGGEAKSDRELMSRIVRERMIPGIMQQNYELFANSVYEFGHRSGLMFESFQGGAYNGPRITELVERIRSLGIPAVGQSSWGPCVFAIARHDEHARKAADELTKIYGSSADIQICKADNNGVTITKD